MSGHSKWHSIRRSKALLDNKRGAVWTKLTREITVAAREGGSPDQTTNFKLRVVIQKAKAANMPADNIDRAIKKAFGGGAEGEEKYEEIIYEGYGPGGSAILVLALTNNRNRTASEVRNAFNKGGGNLGESGSVGWMFKHVGYIRVDPGKLDPDELQLTLIDAGAEDVVETTNEDDQPEYEVYTAFEELRKVQETLEGQGVNVISSEDIWQADTKMELDDQKSLQVLKLMERLEDLEDVQNVYTNLEIRDEVAALQS